MIICPSSPAGPSPRFHGEKDETESAPQATPRPASAGRGWREAPGEGQKISDTFSLPRVGRRAHLKPLQNRVDPFGELFATAARGEMYGNRGGPFHDPKTQTVPGKTSASRQWLCCLLAFKSRRRDVWGRGFTDLFFLDEVTALAAGHRPCFECRRASAKDFAARWQAAKGLSKPPRAPEMDSVLHGERLAMEKPALSAAEISALPDGAMIASAARAFAMLNGAALSWSEAGYGRPEKLESARLLTPPATLAALREGYQPVWHTSVRL